MSSLVKRYTLFPLHYPEAYAYYKKAVATFWTVDEVDFSVDAAQFNTLNDNEKSFLGLVLAFFAASDGIVNENLALSFYDYFDNAEIRAFYSMQMAVEAIHSETYSLLIETLIPTETEKHRLFSSLETSPIIAKKAEWARRWIDNKEASHAQKLIAFIIVEGLFFCGSFAAIFFFRQRGLLPGLCFTNDLISRDESLHFQFGIYLYNTFFNSQRLDQSTVQDMFKEALSLESEFMSECLKIDMIGLSNDQMNKYLEYMSNRLLIMLQYDPLSDVLDNPLSFMATISLDSKVNFFERKNSQYNKIVVQKKDDFALDFDV